MRSCQIRWDFCQIVRRNHWFSQIQCLLCQKLIDFMWKSGWKKKEKKKRKQAWVNGLWVGWVSRVLEEEIRNRPIDIRFLMSRFESDHWIGWFKVGFGRVGQVDDWFGQPYIQLRKLYLEQYHFFIKLWNFIYFFIWKSWNSQNYVDRIFFFYKYYKTKI